MVALVALAAACGVYGLEKYLLGQETRFIENPSDVIMRAFALAHFLIGWLFLLTSPRLRSRQALQRLLLASLVGVGLCMVFAQFGATRNPFLVLFFYAYFLVHEVGDETHLCQAYGDIPSAPFGARGLLQELRRAATAVTLCVLILGYLFHGLVTDKPAALHRVAPALLWAMASLLVGGCAMGIYRYLAEGRRVGGCIQSLLQAHRPLLLVYAGIVLILLFGAPLGSTGFNIVILIHVTAWLVFVGHRLHDAGPATNVWRWLRSTPAGFWTLHLGVVVGVLTLMAVRVYVWHRVGFLSELLASRNFCYWGLMHISTSFWSSR
jgi:hypothetical protein